MSRRQRNLTAQERMERLLARSACPNHKGRRVRDGHKLLCARLLGSAKLDVAKYQETFDELAQRRRAVLKTLAWLYETGGQDDVSFELACQALGRDPEAMRKAILSGAREAAIRAALAAKG